jgi:signal peptidase I
MSRKLVIIAAGVLLFAGLIGFRAFVMEAYRIPAGSMIPTLQVGDHIWVNKMATHPKRGDIIVFKYPKEPDKDFIKRVIAVGGDTVAWEGERPVVNGRPIARAAVDGECKYEDYEEMTQRWEQRKCRAFEETLDGHSWRIYQEPTPEPGRGIFMNVTVPTGSFYVLGDNRDNSHDSRFWGYVPAENVKGTAARVWFSSGRKVRWERVNTRLR